MGLTSVVGDYDAIFFCILLDKTLVQSFLPPHLRDSLCDNAVVNQAFQTARDGQDTLVVPNDKHPVIVLLGRQSSCGPYLLPTKMNFQEAKLEIPFIQHPKFAEPHTFKSLVMFDTRFMTVSSQYIAGIRSRQCNFTPSQYEHSMKSAPSSSKPNSSASPLYQVHGVLETSILSVPPNATRANKGFELDERIVKDILSIPWFGENTGSGATTFTFHWERAVEPLESFRATLRINLATFEYSPQVSGATSGDEGWATFDDVCAWRFRSTWTGDSS
ncbi:hypothetical protein DL93DRAFT_2080934 [Clavulina sp. PMI_390]|nr:hypothetical protein DL93DRAFT_2080934 [Clavulina sp. PMI_390]